MRRIRQMCGRFTLRTPANIVAEYFTAVGVPPFEPRFNIAPTQPVPVIRVAMDATAEGYFHRQFAWIRWGLIPHWADDPSLGDRLINARAETAAEKSAFRAAFRRRRCLVAADGFYEWQKTGRGKRPFFIHRQDQSPFGFAGLWESWEGADHSLIESCTLLTTEPNDLMRPIHNRMPVILSPGDHDRWLDLSIETPELLTPLLAPCPSEGWSADPVGTWVNNPAHDDPKCIDNYLRCCTTFQVTTGCLTLFQLEGFLIG